MSIRYQARPCDACHVSESIGNGNADRRGVSPVRVIVLSLRSNMKGKEMAARQDLRKMSDKPAPGVDEWFPGRRPLGHHLRR